MPTTDRSNTELIRRRRCQVMADGFFPRGTPKDASTELYRKFGDYKYFVDGKLFGNYSGSTPTPPPTSIQIECGTRPGDITVSPENTYTFTNIGQGPLVITFTTIINQIPGELGVFIAAGNTTDPLGNLTSAVTIQCSFTVLNLVCNTPAPGLSGSYVFRNTTTDQKMTVSGTKGDMSTFEVTIGPQQYSSVVENVVSVDTVSCELVITI